MKKNLYKSLGLATIIIVVGIVIYFRNVVKPSKVREHYNEGASVNREIREERRAERLYRTEEEVKSKEKVVIFDEKVDELTRSLNSLEAKIQTRERFCLKTLNEVIENDDYIDIKDPMYDDIESVLGLFNRVLNESMFRPEADELFSQVFKAVESTPKVDPKLLFARIERIDICRDPKALNFVDTIFEAYRIREWPTSVRDKIVPEVFSLLKESVPSNRSVENLLYFTNVLLIMSDNGLIPASYTTELEDLSRRVNENHSMFKDLFGDERKRDANYIILSDYLRRNDELGIELRQVSSDIENVLGVGY